MSIIFTKKCPYCSQIIQGDARRCMYCSKELSSVPIKASVPTKVASKRKHISPLGPILVVSMLVIWIFLAQIHKNGSINSSPYDSSTRTIPKNMMPVYGVGVVPPPFLTGRPTFPPDGKNLRARLGIDISSNFMHHPYLLQATHMHMIAQGKNGGHVLEGFVINHSKVELYNIKVLYQKIGAHSTPLGKGQQEYPFLPPGDKLDLNIPLSPGVHEAQIIQIYGSRAKHPRTVQFP